MLPLKITDDYEQGQHVPPSTTNPSTTMVRSSQGDDVSETGGEEERDHATNDHAHFASNFRYMSTVFDSEYRLCSGCCLVIPVVAAGSINTHLKKINNSESNGFPISP